MTHSNHSQNENDKCSREFIIKNLVSNTCPPSFATDPQDALLNLPHGVIHQQSVTMVAQLFPPAIEASPSNLVWGLPTLAWGILIGCSVLAVLSLATLFLCCWLLPRTRKILSPTRCSSTRTQATDRSGPPRISIHSTEEESAGECFHGRE